MKTVRLVALFGSLMILVFSITWIVHERRETRAEQLADARTASTATAVAVTDRVGALLAMADLAIGTDDVGGVELAASARTVVAEADACVGDRESSCSGADLLQSTEVGDLIGESLAVEGPVAAVDPDSASVLVVATADRDSVTATAVVQVPVDRIVDTTITESGVAIDVHDGSEGGSDADQAATAGERHLVTTVVAAPFVSGSVTVDASNDATVGFAGDATSLLSTLLILSTVLLALAATTFFAERGNLERRATTDELTGLVNRREFERIATEEVERAERLGSGTCVMVVDLNGFKEVNDTHGHQFGDLVLRAVSERLVSAVRDTDVVGRWGGDEFVILLPGLEERSAVRNRAERISDRLAESAVVGDIRMQASIGAAIFPRHGRDLDALIRAADVAMYGAKTTGVGHRIADTIEANDRVARSSAGSPPDRTVATDDYVGPDRRRSPVPPPPPSGPRAAAELEPTPGGHDDGH